jgi:glycosyltransferase involved in cell wall biosynthesis
MRVIQACFFRDRSGRKPLELITAWPTLTDVARAASARVEVSVAVQHDETLTLQCGPVAVHFRPDVLKHVRDAAPDILHVHGLALAAAAPARLLPAKTRIVVQDHGGGEPPAWRKLLMRRGLRGVRAALFTAREQAVPFARVLPRTARVFEVLESSSWFTSGNRESARQRTGLYGDPCALWVGRLNHNKDPFTVLRAIRSAASRLPDLHLWCCYTSTELLPGMQELIASDPVLRDRVHLLGAVPHAEIEQLARAADFFLAASHAEGSGFALIEAIACGLTPVVTDIPSFRWITGDGAIGGMVPIGDHEAMADHLVRLAGHPHDALRALVLDHFARRLSFDAIGRQLEHAYHGVLS